MVLNKRKKSSRMRGSWTHGWGEKKKHRGAGHRGGRGKAGSGKRGDAKKPSFWKNPKFIGKFGFTSGKKKDIKIINLTNLESKLDFFVEQKLVDFKDDVYNVDLKKIGFDKLLGTGKVTKKINLTASMVSNATIEKIKAAGGTIKE